MQSPPSRGCGSKHMDAAAASRYSLVTPFTGVWIETSPKPAGKLWVASHPLHGGVDRNFVMPGIWL